MKRISGDIQILNANVAAGDYYVTIVASGDITETF
jgi:hypothetical protein